LPPSSLSQPPTPFNASAAISATKTPDWDFTVLVV
jgi:hypothetical protein